MQVDAGWLCGVERKGPDVSKLVVIDVRNFGFAGVFAQRRVEGVNALQAVEKDVSAQLVINDALWFIGENQSAIRTYFLCDWNGKCAQIGTNIDHKRALSTLNKC
ncbi:MAG: hypothetical protein IPG34_00265 [Rhodocyclaceae bacterium]|nr:hypothetical protein [Rhodocyclaceae bacterium]